MSKQQRRFCPQTPEDLRELIAVLRKGRGGFTLADIDISNVKDLSCLFYEDKDDMPLSEADFELLST